MAKYVKSGGSWKVVSPDTDSVQTAYVKVDGTWKGVTGAYVKVAGVWKTSFTYSAYIVPYVLNQVLNTGKSAITDSGNIVGTSTSINNAGGATPTNDGKIATQSVSPGTYLSPQTINLTYYTFAYITVPNIVGQVTSTADTLITNAGNTVGTKTSTASGATAGNNNTVASQTVAAGSNYATAQTVGYSYYTYTVPTPSQPSVSLSSKTSSQFTFTTSFGANTTSALAYYGPPGQGNQIFAGNVTYSGQPITVTGLTPGQSYSFMSYPTNTVNVNTVGNVSQGGLPSSQGSVTLDSIPAPTGGSVSLTGSGEVGTYVTATASGFANLPTSYNVYITTTTSGTPTSDLSPLVSSGGGTSASFQVTQGQANAPANIFRAFATATNAGGTSSPAVASPNTITAINAAPQAPNAPGTPSGSDNLSPTGGTFSWSAGSGGSGVLSYDFDIYTSGGSYVTGGGTADTSVQLRQAGTFYIRVRTRDVNTGLTSGYVTSSNYTFTTVASAPSISVTNEYLSSGPNTWRLTISNSGGAATSYSWGIQFSNSSGGSVLASATGSGGSIPAGGQVTVTRNSSTYSWARWVSVVATNSTGDSNTASTGWA